ncbi:IclR family pca regulon transcriptional regulator [Microbacterium endophyticum]|uniref:IclR family pca regulon transcriptional regulator n=1 Tax=Microbacterium endophyticum TaxID=1526412 RepID=A0A7W4V3X3_9MICO|nr:IclR family transcriptional regulator C-terminal domain-containing protein [Microbacterium endophyticum]MBB2975723.1 IclR family pca regulon transcriptional regulator [Microbacterium endophyticum]NIK36206.1 IclR family pca regulon transcriptional regulator [Microbacterium endophyticum]
MTEDEPLKDQPDVVQSFVRGLAVIRAFDAQHPHLSLSEVSRRADITRAAAGRFLRTLESLGYVRNRAGSYALTPRVLELGFSYLSALSLPEVLQPHLERLSHDVNESVSAAVLDGGDIVYVARVPTRRIMSVSILIGTRFPAHATSMGRVLLAGLAETDASAALGVADLRPLTDKTVTDARELAEELVRVRQQGWALVDGELETGLRSIAAPVFDRSGAVVAAINISASAAGCSLEQLRDIYAPALRETADAITREWSLV